MPSFSIVQLLARQLLAAYRVLYPIHTFHCCGDHAEDMLSAIAINENGKSELPHVTSSTLAR
jgi:hypothetical protein